jgi:hypothetical protein
VTINTTTVGRRRQAQGEGTGIELDTNGRILTNNHVVEGAFNDAIAAPLDRYPAESGASAVTVAVDASAVPAGCAATVAVSVRGSVDLAKADALDDMGERRAAHELILQSLRLPLGSA